MIITARTRNFGPELIQQKRVLYHTQLLSFVLTSGYAQNGFRVLP